MRFVLIIPYRNVKPFIKECYESILNQKYQNWIAIFCDDCSTDGTSDIIPKNDDRFKFRYNEKRITALPNIHNGIIESDLKDEDIICILDGDDFLTRNDTLDLIGNLYKDDTLLTYGQYVASVGNIGHCKAYTEETFSQLRTGGYWASHLRTFKYKLYKEMMVQDPDLKCYKDENGEFYTSCYDVALMTPIMEIAGFDKIKFNPSVVYYYRIHSQNDYAIDPILQFDIASKCFGKTPFKKINFNA